MLFGKNFIVLHSTYGIADVYAYDSSIQPIENLPIVTAATAYDNTVTGNTFILVFNEGLYFGVKVDHSLIYPNQICAYGILLVWDNPYDPNHTLSTEVQSNLTLPLRAFGTKVGFNTRVSTPVELCKCKHVHVKSLPLGTHLTLSWSKQQIKADRDRGSDNASPFRQYPI